MHRKNIKKPVIIPPSLAARSLFLLGRTETIHPVSDDAVAWVRAMTDATAAHEDKVRLLRAAITYQNEFRLRATAGLGCDRHLLGLYCASRELGMDLPQMFMDKVRREFAGCYFRDWVVTLQPPTLGDRRNKFILVTNQARSRCT